MDLVGVYWKRDKEEVSKREAAPIILIINITSVT